MSDAGRSLAVFALLAVWPLAAGTAHADDGSRLCTMCHEMARHQLGAHPVSVSILGRVANDEPGLPLDSGRMTCLTCHRGHAGGAPARAADGASDFLLRDSVPGLCARCHLAPQTNTWDKSHARYADTIHGGARLAPLAGVRDGGPAADPLSARCMACHGGAVEEGIVGNAKSIEMGHSHPLGEYGNAAAGDYVPYAEVDKGLRMVDGRLTCVSCHRLYGSIEYRLARTKKDGALCKSCHTFDMMARN